MSSVIDSLMIGFERLLACAPCAARMLRSPFWTGAAHVVQLRPIRIEQRGRESAPSPSRRAQDPPRSRAREQHSRDIRVSANVFISDLLGGGCDRRLTDIQNGSSAEAVAPFYAGWSVW